MHWMNTVVNYCGPFEYEVGYCEKLKNFLEANLEWMQREMELNPDSPYWHQVGQATLLSGGKVALLSVLVSCAVSPWLALSEPETQPNLVSVSICTPPPQEVCYSHRHSHRREASMAALQEAQQAAQRVRCRHLHPSCLTPVVELQKNWKKLRKRVTL